MLAMDDFITIGTQMKIERPGKACAITPSDNTDGPWSCLMMADSCVLMTRCFCCSFESRLCLGQWRVGPWVWGIYGEQQNLVPAGYCNDWWASDLLEMLNSDSTVEEFAELSGLSVDDLPEGLPGLQPEDAENANAQFHIRRKWHAYLTKCVLNWEQFKAISLRFKTAIPNPQNPLVPRPTH